MAEMDGNNNSNPYQNIVSSSNNGATSKHQMSNRLAHKNASPVKKTSPAKQPRFEDSDEDGVQGFTLRLTQVQVSEERKGVTSSAKKNKYGTSSHYRNGSMAYADQEIEEEAAYTEFAI